MLFKDALRLEDSVIVFDFTIGFVDDIFQSEGYFFSFNENFFEMHEIQQYECGHSDIVFAVLFQFFQIFFLACFQKLLIQDFSFRS